VTETDHPFEPESGAYAQHSHDHRLSPIKALHHVHHNAAQLLKLLTLSSTALPVGAYCYSQGGKVPLILADSG
jgi:sterol desaturase/sphingolipid hydroxylase (fatty acid hydroxylase superfamily)